MLNINILQTYINVFYSLQFRAGANQRSGL
jgi:hypothetical protein